jgi:hypothetical protein
MVKADLVILKPSVPGLGVVLLRLEIAICSPSQKTIIVLVVHNKGLLYKVLWNHPNLFFFSNPFYNCPKFPSFIKKY